MKNLIIGCLLLSSLSCFASNLNQTLIDNSEKITELKSDCGSELGGEVSETVNEKGDSLYRFSLQQSVFGAVETECRISIEVDSHLVAVDGPITYKIRHEKVIH